MPPCQPLAAGQFIAGTHYRVMKLLGAGGMSYVYEVEHVGLGRVCVLKVLRGELATRRDLVQRVRNEWRMLGCLRHPNIIRVSDAGMTRLGLPYFVMERLEGETLAQRLSRQRCLAVPEALAIGCQLLSALEACHGAGIIHRDIKPSNVFLPRAAPLKLLDFGIAKVELWGPQLTETGMALGTPSYMSPEQARGQALDGRADLYCVGLLLFEMVVGRRVFAFAKGAQQALTAQLEEPPVALAEVVPGVAMELSQLVERLLAKHPARRPPSAKAVLEVLTLLQARYEHQVSTTEVTQAASPITERGVTAQPACGEVVGALDRELMGAHTEHGMPWTVAKASNGLEVEAEAPGIEESKVAAAEVAGLLVGASSVQVLQAVSHPALPTHTRHALGLCTPFGSSCTPQTENPANAASLASASIPSDQTGVRLRASARVRATSTTHRRRRVALVWGLMAMGMLGSGLWLSVPTAVGSLAKARPAEGAPRPSSRASRSSAPMPPPTSSSFRTQASPVSTQHPPSNQSTQRRGDPPRSVRQRSHTPVQAMQVQSVRHREQRENRCCPQVSLVLEPTGEGHSELIALPMPRSGL